MKKLGRRAGERESRLLGVSSRLVLLDSCMNARRFLVHWFRT